MSTAAKTGHESCPPCETHSLARNNYFTGKLLVERDFTDEQNYLLETQRLHHQRLHGCGVVCGLKVVQHENEACRDRFVWIEPGSAIDCCGRHIVVVDRELVEIDAFEELRKLRDEPDGKDHRLQLCIRYRECPTEDVPVLFDECGCDDTQCEPNRILESFTIELLLDQPKPNPCLMQPALSWKNTITLAHAACVALHEASGRLFVMTDGAIYQLSTANLAVEKSVSLEGKGLALAVSDDGKRLYALAKASDADPVSLFEYDTSGPDTIAKPPRTAKLTGSEAETQMLLFVTPAGQPVTLLSQAGTVQLWDPTADPPAIVATGDSTTQPAHGLARSGDGTQAYVGCAGGVDVFDLTGGGTLTRTKIDLSGVDPADLATILSTGADCIALLDANESMLHVIDPEAGAKLGSVRLDHQPRAVAVSPGGRWAYVVVRDENEIDFIQTVSLHLLRQGKTVTAGTPLEIGRDVGPLVLTASGRRLFAPFAGDEAVSDAGGVAVVDIAEVDCAALLNRVAKCPHCCCDGCGGDHANGNGCDCECGCGECLVLATIEGWQPGRRVEDLADPPTTPTNDAVAGIARIDNLADRRILHSTQTLAKVLECVLDHGVAAEGKQGPPGPPGAQGPQGPEGPQGLQGDRGDDGAAGADGEGLEHNLVQISALSWRHNLPNSKYRFAAVFSSAGARFPGIVIEFSSPIRFPRPGEALQIDHEFTFQVLAPRFLVDNQASEAGFLCYCPLVGTVVAVKDLKKDGGLITEAQEFTPTGPAFKTTAIAFVFTDKARATAVMLESTVGLFVRLRGDFVVDPKGRAIDAEFPRATLPSGDRPAAGNPGAGVGAQGGLFESRYLVTVEAALMPETANPGMIDVNRATVPDLASLGLPTNVAEAIVERAAHQPFHSLDDLREVPGVGDARLELLRDHVRFD